MLGLRPWLLVSSTSSGPLYTFYCGCLTVLLLQGSSGSHEAEWPSSWSRHHTSTTSKRCIDDTRQLSGTRRTGIHLRFPARPKERQIPSGRVFWCPKRGRCNWSQHRWSATAASRPRPKCPGGKPSEWRSPEQIGAQDSRCGSKRYVCTLVPNEWVLEEKSKWTLQQDDEHQWYELQRSCWKHGMSRSWGALDFHQRLTISIMTRIFAVPLCSSVSKPSKLAGILSVNSTREQRIRILKSNSVSYSTMSIG